MYETAQANDSIRLHTGDLAVELPGVAVNGPGLIELRWLPSPRLVFSLEGYTDRPDLLQQDKMRILAPGIGLRSRGLSSGFHMNLARPPGVPFTVTGVLLGQASVPRARGRQRSILFHVSNFPDLFR